MIDIEAMAPDELRRRLRETMADNDRLRRTLGESPAVQPVAVLRALLAEARVALLDGVGTAYDLKAIDTAYEVAARIDAALAEPVRDDYQRGAEAMREAAAIHCATEVCSSQIRALPVPEDKP